MQFKADVKGEAFVTMYVSRDACVGQQLGSWGDLPSTFLIVPCKILSYVAIVSSNVERGTSVPLYAWRLYRPKALELVFQPSVYVTTVQIDALDMRKWSDQFGPWQEISGRQNSRRGWSG